MQVGMKTRTYHVVHYPHCFGNRGGLEAHSSHVLHQLRHSQCLICIVVELESFDSSDTGGHGRGRLEDSCSGAVWGIADGEAVLSIECHLGNCSFRLEPVVMEVALLLGSDSVFRRGQNLSLNGCCSEDARPRRKAEGDDIR